MKTFVATANCPQLNVLRRVMKVLSNPKLILAAFVAFKIGTTVYAFMIVERPILFSCVRVAEVIFLVPFAYLAAKKRTPALFIVGLVLFLQILPACWAVVLISFKHYILKTVTFFVSSYFVYGGYVLFLQAWDNLAIAKPVNPGISGTTPRPLQALKVESPRGQTHACSLGMASILHE
jgi:hypothetical protein